MNTEAAVDLLEHTQDYHMAIENIHGDAIPSHTLWREYTLDTTEDEIIKLFENRHGYKPAHIYRASYGGQTKLLAGPIEKENPSDQAGA